MTNHLYSFFWRYSKTLNFTGDPKQNWSFFFGFTGWISLSEKKITTCMTKPAGNTLKSGRHPPLFTDPIRPQPATSCCLGVKKGASALKRLRIFLSRVWWLVGWTSFWGGGNWLIMSCFYSWCIRITTWESFSRWFCGGAVVFKHGPFNGRTWPWFLQKNPLEDPGLGRNTVPFSKGFFRDSHAL